MAGRLKLKALDAEDLAVVSAAMQDALVAVKDIGWFRDDGRLALVASRFRWEEPVGTGGEWSRTHSALVFDEVRNLKQRNVPLADRDRLLDLLSIRFEGEAGEGAVVLDFAGNRAIRAEVGKLSCRLEDLGEPWPTWCKPDHPGDPSAYE
jgi:hypothetical protein